MQREKISTLEKVQVIRVKDKLDEEHHLILETRESTIFRELDGQQCWNDSRIDVTARYLFGPLFRQVGHTVCSMGGSTTSYNSVRITNGEVMIKIHRLRGLHIGSFMFSRVVQWAKGLDQNCELVPVRLAMVDAMEPDNKARRNAMYENFGLRFDYSEHTPIERGEGSSLPGLKVADLVEYKGWNNIEACSWLDGFQVLSEAYQRAKRDSQRYKHVANFERKRWKKFAECVRPVTTGINWFLILVAAWCAYKVGHAHWWDV